MLTNEDGTEIDTANPIRVTDNDVGEAFPQLSPDGKKIVSDSNRDIPGLPLNIPNLFMMKSDANDQRRLTTGTSATWSPDGTYIAFHRSASGSGLPIKDDPGAATADSDIFVMRVPDLDSDVIDESTMTNITNSEAYYMRTRMALVVSLVVALGPFERQAQDVGHAAAMKQVGIATYSCLPSLGSRPIPWTSTRRARSS